MTDAPTWYDVLDVSRDASTEEVRAAWKGRIADLEPGDRRFDTLNRAAKVLLDPAARAAYDETLPPEGVREALDTHEAEGAEGAGGSASPEPVARPGRAGPGLATRLRRSSTAGADAPGERRGAPSWLLAGLGVLAAGLLGATAWTWSQGAAAGDDTAARDAQVAAERAVVPVLSYDYETLEADQREAQALMTGSYREEYDKLFTVLEDNAPRTQTRVTASVVASGIVRASQDRVQVLVFVDRPTTNKLDAEPVVYKDQVTVSMQRVDGEWLVDDLITSPAQG
ncbi:J domain-containing protein [Nocardioides pinisoli]|uniref:DnaJ domain-containing protein n=1 Tax=Nocardioides pinisoli TaxID=2950279 RepID=A0ABT1KV36_9ACTN|nr:DnaJ domain-containing protein [Nocardioides pinisoli]MCP3421638.1 DnaJ domain-containing protein [Nocardioides pinisoli]